MRYGLTTTLAPEVEPVSLAVAKTHLRIDHDDEDALISAWIVAARQLTEAYTGRRWVTQELSMTLEAFPECNGEIRLPVFPVASVDSITYRDVDGATQTLSTSLYRTWLDHNPPLVALAPDEEWPDTEDGALTAVTVNFTAGNELADVPGGVKAAILLTLGNWDENRGDQNVLIARGLPPAARFLLDSLWTGAYS